MVSITDARNARLNAVNDLSKAVSNIANITMCDKVEGTFEVLEMVNIGADIVRLKNKLKLIKF